jgi:hypothetical protein
MELTSFNTPGSVAITIINNPKTKTTDRLTMLTFSSSLYLSQSDFNRSSPSTICPYLPQIPQNFTSNPLNRINNNQQGTVAKKGDPAS